jgi:hypothetical protein
MGKTGSPVMGLNSGNGGTPAAVSALLAIDEQLPNVMGSVRSHVPFFCKSARAAASCAGVVLMI